MTRMNDLSPEGWADAPDEALLVAYANGDGAAGRILIERLGPRLFGYASRVLKDRTEAEDVVQEAMIRLWRIAPDWRQGEAKVSTWAYRVVSNLCTDRLRKSGRSVALDAVAEPEDDKISAVDGIVAGERVSALEEALGKLPDRQQQAVVLRHLEGLANPEVAKVMDISVEAVESLVARGKRALAADLVGRKAELGFRDDG